MAYNNYFPQGYQPMYPTLTNINQPTPWNVGNNQPNAQSSLIWVQGEAGAKSYMVAPNSSVTLWDSEAPVIYLKSADQSGIPNIRIIDYTFRDIPAQTEKSLPVSDFAKQSDVDYLKNELEALRAKFGELEGSKKK